MAWVYSYTTLYYNNKAEFCAVLKNSLGEHSYLYKAKFPPVERSVDGRNGCDGQNRQQPKTHNPKGNVHLHSPHFLLIPRIFHMCMDLPTQSKATFISQIWDASLSPGKEKCHCGHHSCEKNGLNIKQDISPFQD